MYDFDGFPLPPVRVLIAPVSPLMSTYFMDAPWVEMGQA